MDVKKQLPSQRGKARNKLPSQKECADNSPPSPTGVQEITAKKKPKLTFAELKSAVAANSTAILALQNVPKLLQDQQNKIQSLVDTFAPFMLDQNTNQSSIGDHCEGFEALYNSVVGNGEKDNDTSNNNGSENDEESSETDAATELIDQILNSNSQVTEYGKDLSEEISQAFKRAVAGQVSKTTLDISKERYKTPGNCKELGAPKVNLEIWSKLPRKTQTVDASFQYLQQHLSRGLIAQAQVISILTQSKSRIPKDLLESLMRTIMDSSAEIGAGFRELSLKRRSLIRPLMTSESSGLCSSNTPITEFLFGDNIEKEISASKVSSRIIRGSSFTRGQRFQPYSRGPARGNFRNLNFRPSPRFRGGFQNRNQQNFQPSQQFHRRQ